MPTRRKSPAIGYKLPLIQRMFNAWVRLWVRLGLPPQKYHLLTVVGRHSGRERTIPVSVVQQDKEQWLVCPYGERQWVKNVRASQRLTLRRGLSKQDFTATEETNPPMSAAVLRAYYRSEPITRKFFRAGTDSSLAEFAAEAALHPVFRLSKQD